MPTTVTEWATLIVAVTGFVAAFFAFLSQRQQAQHAREQAAAERAERVERAEFEALRAALDELREENSRVRAENAELRHTVRLLQNELDELRGRRPRNTTTGELRPIL